MNKNCRKKGVGWLPHIWQPDIVQRPLHSHFWIRGKETGLRRRGAMRWGGGPFRKKADREGRRTCTLHADNILFVSTVRALPAGSG